MADNTDTPNNGTNTKEKTDDSKTVKDEENNEEKKSMSEETTAGSSEDKEQDYCLHLTESVSDPVCVLQMSGEQILAPETEDDGISIIPPSPGAYREPPFLIPTSPGEAIEEEDNEKKDIAKENVEKDNNDSSLGKNVLPKDDISEEYATKGRNATSPCCRITFSQDSTDESLEIAETQMSVDEGASSKKRKHMDHPCTDIDQPHFSSNHSKKIARIEAERAEEPHQEYTISKQISMEETVQKQRSGSPHSKGEIGDTQPSNEGQEWHLQLSCGTEPMECTLPEDSSEERAKGSINVPKEIAVPGKEVIPEGDQRLAKEDTLPLFQIQKPVNIEQSSGTSDAKEDTTVFSHIQNLSLVSEDLTDESIGTPELREALLSSTLINPNLVKDTSHGSLHTNTPERSLSDEVKEKTSQEIPLHSTQDNGTRDNLPQLISHKVVKGQTHPVVFTDTLDEEHIACEDGQKSNSARSSIAVKHHEASAGNKKQLSNIGLTDEGKSQKKCTKIITKKSHITTREVITNDKVVKRTITVEEDDPIIEYCADDVSPILPSHHSSFSSGELADVSSSVASKSVSSGSSSSLFAFPYSPSVRRNNSEGKSRVIQKSLPIRLDVSTDTETWSDSKQGDRYSCLEKPKTKWKLNSEATKTSSLGSSSLEIPVLDVPESKQSRVVLPGVRVMARWKDGCFYPGKVSAKDPEKNKWVILYDDGGKASVSAKDLIVVSLLEKGQRVLALSEDGCYDPGIIKDYYKEGKEVGYVVERDYNETTRYSRSAIILSGDEALSLLKSKADTSTSSDREYCNTAESRRRQSPRMNISQQKKEKVKNFPYPLVDSNISEQQSSNGEERTAQRRTTRKKSKNGEGSESKHCEITHSPRTKDSPASKRKLHWLTGEHGAETPGTSKKSPYHETATKSGEKEGSFKSPKVQKAERCKISKLTGETEAKDNKLFEGFAFLLSTGDRKNEDDSNTDVTEEEDIEAVNKPFDKSQVEKEIEERGGTVLDSIEGIQNTEGKRILLLANDYLRTVKYMHCLAEGIPCISHIWVKDCCATGEVQSYKKYLLPAGFSIIKKELVEWHGRKEVLKGLHILVSSSKKDFVDIWSPIVIAAEAKLVHRIPPQRKSTDVPCTIDAVVTDISCPQNVLRRAIQMKIPVVSVEWVIQCLIAGERIPVDSHPKFNYDYVP